MEIMIYNNDIWNECKEENEMYKISQLTLRTVRLFNENLKVCKLNWNWWSLPGE